MTLARVTDHAARADRLHSFLRGKLVPAALVKSFLGEFQDLEDTIWDLLELRSLAASEGAQLDVLGRILGRRRDGRADVDYRIVLEARVLELRASGAVEEIYAVFDALEPGATISIEEMYPAKFRLSWTSPPLSNDEAMAMAQVLHGIKAAGVGAYFYWWPDVAENMFAFAAEEGAGAAEVPLGDLILGDDPLGGSADATLGAGQGFADTDQATGGRLAGVILV